MQVPPGQHHESPTEQYWNALPVEQPTLVQPHVNPYVQNCHLNANPAEFDGIELALEEGEWSC